jgi:hypothetical protein
VSRNHLKGTGTRELISPCSGNGGLNYEEAKSHFTAWALMKSPLLIGTNLSAIDQPTLDILTNKEIIAINQDPVYGESVSPFRWGTNVRPSFPPLGWPAEGDTARLRVELELAG